MSPPISTRFAEALAGWPPPVLDPAGPYAQQITILAWALIAVGVIVTLIVALFVGIALWGDERTKRRLGGERLIWAGGVAFPVVGASRVESRHHR